MAPKVDKNAAAAAAKKIEDKTFGMKNKNKCAADAHDAPRRPHGLACLRPPSMVPKALLPLQAAASDAACIATAVAGVAALCVPPPPPPPPPPLLLLPLAACAACCRLACLDHLGT